MSFFDLPLRNHRSRAAFALLDPFTQAYVRTGVGASLSHIVPQLGFPPDFDDLHPDTIERMVRDCSDFLSAFALPLFAHLGSPAFENQEAGAALWLARHGRDIGFLNGDWPEPLATRLDAAAKSLGICALYLGSERKVRHLDMPPRRPNSSFNLNYCAACQASPRWGFCQLPRCPHAPSDLFAVTSKAEPQEAR